MDTLYKYEFSESLRIPRDSLEMLWGPPNIPRESLGTLCPLEIPQNPKKHSVGPLIIELSKKEPSMNTYKPWDNP